MVSTAAAGKPLLKDPYAYDPNEVEEPPRSFWGILRRIGPGMILASAIVGSGELIATTTLGAEVGYVALWLIILSCAAKPAIQAEIGRYSIATGTTGLQAFNDVPGPRLKVNWVVWAWIALTAMTRFQIGAMFGGVAQALYYAYPLAPVSWYVVGLLILTIVLLLGGGYQRIERLAAIQVGLFTVLTFLCALLLMRRPQDFAWADMLEGLRFHLPPNGFASAVAVFGITGVGASELVIYPYWCVEKGYARFVGPREPGPAWRSRAFGWIKVMHLDILFSLVIYTMATLSFYMLGAGILHSRHLVPNATQMIPRLSAMYTETLGPWALYLFYLGAIVVLYGTVFAATAADSRAGADLLHMLGWFRADDYRTRCRYRNILMVLLSTLGAGFYLVFESPVVMVKVGGVGQALMLPILTVTALYLRYRRLPREVFPSHWITVGLWVASVATITLMLYYAVLLVTRW